MSIGDMKPVILEIWEQQKNSAGSLVDTNTHRYKLWAEVKYDSGNRSLKEGQTKLEASYTFKIWANNWQPNGLDKIIYDGKRLTIQSIQKINEVRFNYQFKTEANVNIAV